MNFEGFQDLICRVAISWWKAANKELKDIDSAKAYLQTSPFNATQTPENESAYQDLIDVRLKLYEITYEIDKFHDSYMEFMHQVFEHPDLLTKVTQNLSLEEKHLVHLELLIMEQVEDWEIDIGKVDQESDWTRMKKMVVDLPNGKTKTIVITQKPQKRYWFGMCPISSKIGNLKLCSGCRVVGYIGKEEQKEDWPNHKNLCKVLTKLRNGSQHWLSEFSDRETFTVALRKAIGRTLNQYELDIGLYPRKCAVCGDHNQDSLVNCQKCYCVAFCIVHKNDGQLDHTPHCALLRTALEDHKFEITVGHQVTSYSPSVLTKYEPLPGDTESFFSEDVSSVVSKKLPGYRDSESRFITFLYTCPLSVIHALSFTGLKNRAPLEEAQSLTIHLVGARSAEIRHITGWEIIACRLPKLTSLKLVFIGDECEKHEFPKKFSYKGKSLQSEGNPKLKIDFVFETGCLYHDYVLKSSDYDVPDAVVALDCGFKFYPNWKKSIPLMAHRGVPLIFTEFNLGDTLDDLQVVKSLLPNMEILIEPKDNPFRSKKPFRCSDSSGNYIPNSVFFTNDYIAAVLNK